MNSFCISGWTLQDQGPPAHTAWLRDGSAVHDSGTTLCLALAALCVNCCHNNTNRAKTKRPTNCQHDSNSSSNSNRDNKQLAAIVVVAADVAAFAVYCLLGVIFIGAYYLHIPARSGVAAGIAHCCRRRCRCRCCRYCCCYCCCCRLYYVIASSAPTAAPLYRHPSCTLCRN